MERCLGQPSIWVDGGNVGRFRGVIQKTYQVGSVWTGCSRLRLGFVQKGFWRLRAEQGKEDGSEAPDITHGAQKGYI